MKRSKSPHDPDWAALLRNAKTVDLEAVRAMQEAHRRLFHFQGPPPVGAFVRLFRLVGLFGFFAMKEKRFPVLNRAWTDLNWILRNPEADEFSVAGWVFLDLPVTDDGRTVAEVFAAEIAPDDVDLRSFAELTRRSRCGLYVDDGGTRQIQQLVELITQRRLAVARGIDAERGEVIWGRVIDFGGMKFILGNTRGWPPSRRESVTNMLLDRLASSHWVMDSASEAEIYERFMKLAGPYWLSVLYGRSDDDPILDPHRYATYQSGPVPDLSSSR